MDIYFMVVMFMFGAVLGSFYNVVGYRLPKGESLVYPSSHCTNCNHKLRPYELIPIFSYLFLGGKCSKCKQKISCFYTIFEFLTGILFVISYVVFKDNVIEMSIALTFSSLLIIICVSDFHYMVISDSVLLFFGIALLIEIIIRDGFEFYHMLIDGMLSFFTMFLIKIIGDKVFKRESMGGGDIKLMFIIGMVLGYLSSICTIFVGSIIGLPVALLILKFKKEHELPFGPLLAIGALILYFTNFSVVEFFTMLSM